MMSSTQATTLYDHTLATMETREVLSSRFGDIAIDTRNALAFPKGLLGLPQFQNFALANFPSVKMAQFKLLQSLDDVQLSFISLPLTLSNAIIKREDLLSAAGEVGIMEENLVILCIVCVHRGAEGTKLSVNARAPVLIDAERKAGLQYVFLHDQYKVQHFIT